jgi:hypothetical protein
MATLPANIETAVDYEAHPASALFRMMNAAELNDLAQDIRTNGLLEPIVLLDGKVLDGRNRLQACKIAGVETRFVRWSGIESPTAYAVSKNLFRRHLTTAERATIGVEMLPMLQEESRRRLATSGPGMLGGRALSANAEPPFTNSEKAVSDKANPEYKAGACNSYAAAAKAVHVAQSTIGRAKVVKDLDPEAYERLRRGESAVNTEYVKLRRKPQGRKHRFKEGGRRAAIRSTAARRKLIAVLSEIRGLCRGLVSIQFEAVIAEPSFDRKPWAKTARDSAAKLRTFAAALESAK